MEEPVRIGKIVKPFGYKGEIKILLDISLGEGFKDIEAFFIPVREKFVPYFIQDWKQQQNPLHFIVKLDDVDSKEDAQFLNGKDIYLPADQIDIEEDFGFADLKGFKLIDQTSGFWGFIEEVMELPQHDVAQITINGKEVLVPLQEELIVEINEQGEEVTVNLPEGFLDVYLK